MAADVAETTRIERPPRGREEVPVQISRLLDAHQIIIGHCRQLARRASELGDDGTNDLVVSDVLRANELQVWFLSEHLVDVPLVHAEEPDARKAGCSPLLLRKDATRSWRGRSLCLYSSIIWQPAQWCCAGHSGLVKSTGSVLPVLTSSHETIWVKMGDTDLSGRENELEMRRVAL